MQNTITSKGQVTVPAKIRQQPNLQTGDKLLHTASIRVEDHALAENAIDLFMNSTADFSDCLIVARNKSRSISPTHTMDRKAAKLEGFQLL